MSSFIKKFSQFFQEHDVSPHADYKVNSIHH